MSTGGLSRRAVLVLVLLFALIVGYATFMVLLGNRLIGEFLVWATEGNRTAQVVLGLVWMPVAIGLGLFSGRSRHRWVRIGLRVGCGVMSLLAWMVVPIGPRGHAEGAGEYAPWVAVGLGVGLLIGCTWWLVVGLARRRRRART